MVKDYGACSILSPLLLHVTWWPCLHPSWDDTTCFDTDTVQAQSGLQRKTGSKIPQFPFLL